MIVDDSTYDEDARTKFRGTIAPDAVETAATEAKKGKPLIFNQQQTTSSISK